MSGDAKTSAERALEAVQLGPGSVLTSSQPTSLGDAAQRASIYAESQLRAFRTTGARSQAVADVRFFDALALDCYAADRGEPSALLAACRAVDPEHARLVAAAEGLRAEVADLLPLADAQAFAGGVAQREIETLRAQLAAANERAGRAWEDGRAACIDSLRTFAKFETIAGHATIAAAINALAHIAPPEAPDAE